MRLRRPSTPGKVSIRVMPADSLGCWAVPTCWRPPQRQGQRQLPAHSSQGPAGGHSCRGGGHRGCHHQAVGDTDAARQRRAWPPRCPRPRKRRRCLRGAPRRSTGSVHGLLTHPCPSGAREPRAGRAVTVPALLGPQRRAQGLTRPGSSLSPNPAPRGPLTGPRRSPRPSGTGAQLLAAPAGSRQPPPSSPLLPAGLHRPKRVRFPERHLLHPPRPAGTRQPPSAAGEREFSDPTGAPAPRPALPLRSGRPALPLRSRRRRPPSTRQGLTAPRREPSSVGPDGVGG